MDISGLFNHLISLINQIPLTELAKGLFNEYLLSSPILALMLVITTVTVWAFSIIEMEKALK
jgi:hypothetical protein